MGRLQRISYPPVSDKEKARIAAIREKNQGNLTFGKLTLIRVFKSYGLCKCSCGRDYTAYIGNIVRGLTKSCGCRQRYMISNGLCNLRHGHSIGTSDSTHNIWCKMRRRCSNPKDAAYERYGGRGITVCDRWQVFENFLDDMGERPPGKSIDRIDNEGNYEPGNCKWSTPKEQANNRRPRRWKVRPR